MKKCIFRALFLIIAVFFSCALMLSACNDAPSMEEDPSENNNESNNDYVAEAKTPSTEGVVFEQEGEEYTVIGYDGTEKEVVIGFLHNGLPITKIKEGAFESNKNIESVKILRVGIELEKEIFKDCSNLKSVQLPEGITDIPTRCFENCDALTEFNIPKSVTAISNRAFLYCDSITKIELHDNIRSIGEAAFANCSNLAEISFGENVTYIGRNSVGGTPYSATHRTANGGVYVGTYFVDINISNPSPYFEIQEGTTLICANAFTSWYNIIQIKIPDSVKYINSEAFYKSGIMSIVIPESVEVGDGIDFRECANLEVVTINAPLETLSRRAFYKCEKLKMVTLPVGLKEISYEMFAYCNKLSSIVIPETVTTISQYAFYKCASLESIELPQSVTNISYGAFSGCSKLSSANIPTGVNEIPGSMFADCVALNYIVLHGNIKSVGSRAFENTAFINDENNYSGGAFYLGNRLLAVSKDFSGKFTIREGTEMISANAFKECALITEVVIPEGITEIPNSCFSKCASLTNVSLPQSLTLIGDSAFFDCSALETIEIPEGVTDIHTYAFYNCSSLKEVEIPVGITKIADSILKGCSALERVSIPEGVVTIGSDAFEACVSLKSIELPQSLNILGGEAFLGCEKLEKIFIRKNVEAIGSGVFYGCVSLAEITVEPGNMKYISYENCLIEIERKFLLAVGCNSALPNSSAVEYIDRYALSSCPNLKELVISRYIKEIKNMNSSGHPAPKFTACTQIESITVENTNPYYYSSGNCIIDFKTGDLITACASSVIPTTENVTKIVEFAFNRCINLKSITIPKNITQIASSAFTHCENLTDVYYEGTKAEFDAIAPSGWNSFGSKNCVLHCADGDFEVEYKEVLYW